MQMPLSTIIITLIMNQSDKIRRYSADKLAFLGLLILTLLIARFITASRSKILFSGPITLDKSGLSVPIPLGNGWASDGNWHYNENAFSLSSDFLPIAGPPVATARCRLLLAAAQTDPQVRFNEIASVLDGALVEIYRAYAGTLAVDWAHIRNRKTRANSFVGSVSLPYNRRLDIEVHQGINEGDLARRIFEKITAGIKFEDNQLLRKGSEVVEQLKNAGVSSFLDNHRQEDYYLIKTGQKRTVGFLMEGIMHKGNSQLNINACRLLHMRDPRIPEQSTSLESDDSFDEFVWEGQSSGFFGRAGIQIIRSRDGTVTANKLGPRAGQKEYLPGTATIPDAFFDQFLRQMLQSGERELIVDLLKISHADVEIVPALVCLMDAPDGAEKNARYQFRVEFLDERGSFEHIYLDSSGRTYKVLVRVDQVYIIERSSLKELTELFPKRADVILKKRSTLRRNQLNL